MPGTILSWLDGVGSTAFTLSAMAFVSLNVIAIVGVFLTRDRSLVNRWTPHFLAANLLLLGTGLGVPLAALAARTVISAVTPSFHKAGSADVPLRSDMEAGAVSR
jgi:hypothetical protein